jgi:hypothetical protein
MRIHIIIAFIGLQLLAACDTGGQRPIDTPEIQEEIARREPRRLQQGDLVAAALQQGKQLADTAQAALLKRLQQALQEKGPAGAVEYCHTAALPLLDSVDSEGVHIRRTSLQVRSPQDTPDLLEQQLLDAYAYSAEKGLPLQENVQALGDTAYLFTKPIMLANPLCLNCHGQKGSNILPETQARIDSLYPKDQATGYQLGDFRGMWSIRIPKRYVLNHLR